ncbi:phage major capsid protein [Novosphingobium piscinae]|uniref:Phage major capsid protein n=1 Tax=Novosphingobium piscinae TaxID=1507448 RepID=A0A7X1KR97_9SPHN|nr:phage major capsid protein [Novosphingobium piscinae]MBC2670512.1 phage major capsid protein [Novosphingobium piscinae]
METETLPDPLDRPFDLADRQAAAEAALAALQGDLTEVKSLVERLSRSPARPLLAGAEPRPHEVTSFVEGYLRQGRDSALKAQTKAMSQGSLPDGGYAVPREIDAAIAQVLKRTNPIRTIAQVVQTGTSGYRKLIMTAGAASGWTSETGARPETASPRFMEVVPPYGELYANPSATQAMLDDAMFDLEAWLADEIGREFARAEGAAFVNGSGTNQPRGFLMAPATTQPDAARAYGTLQFLPSGNASGFDAAPDLKLLDLVHALKSGHRQGAVFVMNSATLGQLRKLKGTDGQYLYQNSLVDGHPVRLLGYPVVEADDMPDIAAGNVPIAFGNFASGYLITERSTTTILRDPYTNKPFVNFYATKRIGGQVLNSDAIKLLKIAA